MTSHDGMKQYRSLCTGQLDQNQRGSLSFHTTGLGGGGEDHLPGSVIDNVQNRPACHLPWHEVHVDTLTR